MFTHIAVVRDLVAMQYKEYQEVVHLISQWVKITVVMTIKVAYKM